MKKIFFLIINVLLTISLAFGAKITVNQARQAGSNFYFERYTQHHHLNYQDLKVSESFTKTFNGSRPASPSPPSATVSSWRDERAIDPVTGHSVLHGRRTTALTWSLEQKAWGVARYTRFWDPNYYRTYLEEPGQPWGYMSVQQEVTRALADPGDFKDVEKGTPDRRRKTNGRARDTMTDSRPAWVVRDGSYVSARWPGDAFTFARTFAGVLTGDV